MGDLQRHQPTSSEGVTPALLSFSATLAYLGDVGETTLKSLMARGLLQSVKIGRRRLFIRAELDRYIESLRRADGTAEHHVLSGKR